MKKLLLIMLSTLFLLSFISAAGGCLVINSKNAQGFLNEISSLNSQLSTCTITLPSKAKSLIGDGNLLITINMNSGATEQFYITIKNMTITGFTKGAPSVYSYEATMSEATFDKILQSNDPEDEILKGVQNKDIIIKANSFLGKIKWFIAKLFLPKPATTPSTSSQGPTGKPDYCDETYLPGHREYANNKQLWDSYSADTDKVCQSQYGKGTPSPCIHSVQLSIEGKPYYLCWYNE